MLFKKLRLVDELTNLWSVRGTTGRQRTASCAYPMSKPIVLAHGLKGWGGRLAKSLTPEWTYFYRLEQLLRDYAKRAGTPPPRLLLPNLGNGHPAVRAKRLLEAIHAWDLRRPNERVTLVGHSQGGLDARYAISRLHADELVSRCITISTPHRGSMLCVRACTIFAPSLRTRVSGSSRPRLARAGLDRRASDRAPP